MNFVTAYSNSCCYLLTRWPDMSISTLGSKGHFADEGSVGTFRELQSQFDSDKANFDSVALCAEVMKVM